MNKKLWSVGMMILITLLAFGADYGKALLKADSGKNFNFTPGILFLLLANFIFLGLFYGVVHATQKDRLALFPSILFMIVGCLLILLEWAPIRSRLLPLPLQTLQVTYGNLTAGLWIVIGVFNLLKPGRQAAG
ncbi:hypothetical protein LARV_01283 [Longilinea arvoryzae]|uniref:Uncharacterized protein n=1 Tax=Longilinea arvoryzae TaxID=360412 RepID=A0A0S7BDS1_9CHLR|nr:hypothetical protein [Longilinea arvoryzae]GAP13529.1 hypothetical protein LARV_01283 [Longilinea arvoryzae]